MSFAKFVDFLALYVSGEIAKDQTYKYYDMGWHNGSRRLRFALRKAGFRHSEISVSLAELAVRVREWGYDVSKEILERAVCEWYVWQRIVDGDVRQWITRETTTTKRRK